MQITGTHGIKDTKQIVGRKKRNNEKNGQQRTTIRKDTS